MIGVFKKKPELPEYLAHYGMHRAPFSAAIENDMYYVEPTRKQRLDILLHLTQYTNELLVVTGEKGIGKTMFLQQFIKSAGEHWKICTVQGHKMMTEEQFLQRVYMGFGIAHASIHKSTMLANLKKRLDSQLEQALPVILLIDDAHLFSSKVLSLILELASIRNVTSGTSVRVVLLSEPQIKIILAQPELDEKHRLIVRKIDLPPFDETHTGYYLRHRLSQAGMATEQFLTKQTIRKIYKQSNGIPSRINEVADKLLFETTPIIRRTSHVQAQKKMAGLKYIVIVLLAGFVLAGYWFQNYFKDENHATSETEDVNHIKEQTPEKTVTPLKLPTLNSAKKDSEVKNEADTVKSAATPETVDPMQSLKDELASKTTTPSTEPAPTSTGEKIQFEQVAQPKVTAETQLNAEKLPKPAPPQANDRQLKDANWVMQQNPQHFTLQLLTARQQATIERFINQHKLHRELLAYFYSSRNEKNWHNLIYGVYTNRASANTAIKQLPPELANVKPWIRQFRSIQSEVVQVQ
ncbi:AAA family ATPase [Kaarinaea lacus]